MKGVSIALVDDHVMLRNGLASLIKDLGYRVLFEASDGIDFIDKLGVSGVPDLVLMDINMPKMDGYETCSWVKLNHPEVRVLALSMFDDEDSIMRMIRNGARGYVLKDCEFGELRMAIDAVVTKGFHYSERVTGRLVHSIQQEDDRASENILVNSLTPRELEFVKFAATDLTYKQIADQMHVSPRTVDGYRDDLFEKLQVKSRVGLVLFAIKYKIVNV
jgi:two-component system, NarL family, invasion response regulator UvrY